MIKFKDIFNIKVLSFTVCIQTSQKGVHTLYTKKRYTILLQRDRSAA